LQLRGLLSDPSCMFNKLAKQQKNWLKFGADGQSTSSTDSANDSVNSHDCTKINYSTEKC